MDSDFKTPSSESSDETKMPSMDSTATPEDSSTTDVDSMASDRSTMPDVNSNHDSEESGTSMSSAESLKTTSRDESSSFKPDTFKQSSSIVTPPVKIKSAHKFIYGYVGLIILVAAVVGVYVWQHNKVTSLNDQVIALNSELGAQQQKVTSLQTQLTKADAANSSAPAILGLSVVKATRYTPSATGSAANSGVAVDVSLTNSTDKAVSIVTSNFKLEDANKNNYVATNFPTQTTDSSLPSGYTLLIDQSLAPNTTIQGTLEFSVPTTTLTAFTLVYNSQTLTITAN